MAGTPGTRWTTKNLFYLTIPLGNFVSLISFSIRGVRLNGLMLSESHWMSSSTCKRSTWIFTSFYHTTAPPRAQTGTHTHTKSRKFFGNRLELSGRVSARLPNSLRNHDATDNDEDDSHRDNKFILAFFLAFSHPKCVCVTVYTEIECAEHLTRHKVPPYLLETYWNCTNLFRWKWIRWMVSVYLGEHSLHRSCTNLVLSLVSNANGDGDGDDGVTRP